MQRIDTTSIKEIYVEIDGQEYKLAPKTVATVNDLLSVYRRNEGEPEYKLWLEEMRVILGEKAAAALFNKGRQENVDRIHRIRSGVMRAFDTNADETIAEEMESSIEQMNRATAALTAIVDKIGKVTRLEDGPTSEAKGVIRRG